MYRHNHHPDTIDDKVKFRLRLLKFATLFTRRFVENEATPSPEALQELRQTIRTRAREWLVEQDTPEFDQEYLEFNAEAEELHRNKGLFVHRLALPPDFVDFYGSDRSVTLLDLLPSFLATASSMRRVFSTNMSQMFMELAATFMMQASMEQYLVYGSKGVGPLMECFAWGWRRSPSEVWQDEADVIQMFKDEDLQEEVDGWAEVRSKYFNLVSKGLYV